MDKHHYHLELIELGNIHFTEHKYHEAQEEYLAAIYGYISDNDYNTNNDTNTTNNTNTNNTTTIPKDEVYLLSIIEEWINRINIDYKEETDDDKYISYEEIMIVLTSLIKFTESKKHTKQSSSIEISNLYNVCLRIIDISIDHIKNNNYRYKILHFKVRVLRSLADTYRDAYNYDQSINYINQSLNICYEYFNNKLDTISDCMTCKAAILSEHCEYDDAIKLHKEALANRILVYGDIHEVVAASMHYIAMILLLIGNYIEAKKYSDDCLNIRLQILPSDSPIIASSLFLQARLLYLIGNYDESLEIMQKSLTIRELKFGVNHGSVAQSMSGLADILQMKGDFKESLRLHKLALEIREKFPEFSIREIGQSYYCLGMNAFLSKDYTEAKSYFDKSLEIRESLKQKIQVGAHISVIETNIAIGRLLIEQGQVDQGIPLLEESNKVMQKIFGKDDHPLMAESLISLASAMESKGRTDYANECKEKANSIRKNNGIIIESAKLDETNRLAKEKEDSEIRIAEENSLKEKSLALEKENRRIANEKALALEEENRRIANEKLQKEKALALEEERRLKEAEIQKQKEFNDAKAKQIVSDTNSDSESEVVKAEKTNSLSIEALKSKDPKTLTVEEELALKKYKLEEEEAAERAEAEKKKKEAIIKSMESKITFILGKPTNNDEDWSQLKSYKETIVTTAKEIYGDDAAKKKEAEINAQIKKTEDARAEKKRQIEEAERKKKAEEEAEQRKIEEAIAAEQAEIRLQESIKEAVENIRIALSKRNISLIEKAVASYKLFGVKPPAIECEDARLLLIDLHIEEKQKQRDAERRQYFEQRRVKLEHERQAALEQERIDEEKQLAKENAIKKYLQDQEKEEKERENRARIAREMKMKAEADALAKKEAERLSKLPKIQRELLELRSSQQYDRDVFKVKPKLRLGIRKKDMVRLKELSPLKAPVFTIESNLSPSKMVISSIKPDNDNHVAFDKDEVFHAVDEVNLKKYDIVSIQEIDRTIHRHHNDLGLGHDNEHIDDTLRNAITHHSYTNNKSNPITDALKVINQTFPQFTSSESSIYSLEDSLASKSSMRSKIYPQLQVNILRKKFFKGETIKDK